MNVERRGLYKIKSELVDEMTVVAKSLEDAIRIFRKLNGTAYNLFKVEYIHSVEVEVDND